jgi:DNA-binding NtrC family response regulator
VRAPAEVLIIDDDPTVHRALTPALGAFSVRTASSGEEGLAHAERCRPDVVLLDVMLPQMGGMAVLRALRRSAADLPVIMMTGFAEVQSAVQAIKLGAVDYLQKPLDVESVRRRVELVIMRAPNIRPAPRAAVVGESAAMKRVWHLLERFAPTDIPVLLQGETGTGKGLIAEALHQLSSRASAPFVAIDCATIPGDLAESELFGYEDGAFTGAGKRRRGRVAFADRGTLFLDEIGTLAVATQCKLLTLLERQSFLPLGARTGQPTHLDVRFVSATNVPLLDAVDSGTFRSDLYHRLNGVTIELPPLRDRGEDVVLLAHHFVGEFGRRQGKNDLELSADAAELLQSYPWPGNVRELQRVLSVAVVLADRLVAADDLPDHVRHARHTRVNAPPRDFSGARNASEPVLDAGLSSINLREIKEWAGREAQKRVILELQSRTNISRQDLARMLGVDAKTLRSRLKDTRAPKPRPAS